MKLHIRQKITRINLLYSHYKRMPKMWKGFNLSGYNGNSPKSVLTKIIDYLYIFFVLKILPNNYHLFGFDLRNRSEFKYYLGDTTEPIYFQKLRTNLWSHSILVHDKLVFKCLCLYHNLPVSQNFGILKNRKINEKEISVQEFMLENNLKRVIIKPVLGGGGRGIHLVTFSEPINYQQLEEIDKQAGNFMIEGYLIEEVIIQHPNLDEINPYTVNSIRILTILCPDGKVAILAAILKTNSTNEPMDNFSKGGIVIGVDLETGILKENGIMNYPQVEIFKQHPLTKTKFLGFQIPFWPELKDIVEKAQKVFQHVPSLGWDIAITSEGPVIIEGNQNWGTNGIQAANGGLLTRKNKGLFKKYGITFYE